MRRINLTLTIFFSFLFGKLFAQETCPVDSLVINSGYNHSTKAVYNLGDPDAFWTVVSDPDNNTTEPRPAFAINRNPAWSIPFLNTQWISSYPNAANDRNGLYEFEFIFCMNSLVNPMLNLKLLADDSAQVFLNGNFILSTEPPSPGSNSFNDPNPHSATITNSAYFLLGQNTIRVKLTNVFSVAMGFNLSGVLKFPSGTLALDEENCCKPYGKIQGMKWNDLNGNGIKDSGEPPLQNWTITLQGSSTAYTTTTDVLGNYYFSDVPVGNYAISETNQVGWIQTYPAGNLHAVTVARGQVLINKDFGNKTGTSIPPPPCKDCIGSFKPEPGKVYIVSAWAKEAGTSPAKTSYNFPQLIIEFPSLGTSIAAFSPAGAIIDGWQRIEGQFTIPLNATDIGIKLQSSRATVFFDDIRIFPYDGTMKTYVYDPITLRLAAELDERNYATIYEYDEEGKLTRVKKETEKGVMTIKENKSSSKKK
jgi:hypothetical protein